MAQVGTHDTYDISLHSAYNVSNAVLSYMLNICEISLEFNVSEQVYCSEFTHKLLKFSKRISIISQLFTPIIQLLLHAYRTSRCYVSCSIN